MLSATPFVETNLKWPFPDSVFLIFVYAIHRYKETSFQIKLPMLEFVLDPSLPTVAKQLQLYSEMKHFYWTLKVMWQVLTNQSALFWRKGSLIYSEILIWDCRQESQLFILPTSWLLILKSKLISLLAKSASAEGGEEVMIRVVRPPSINLRMAHI